MHIAFLNPQGNFDPQDRYWTQHPDFGGQLVYVKQVANALTAQGHTVDILTRRIVDPRWPGFESRQDAYPAGARIVRLHAGPNDRFVPKEDLWPLLGSDWVPDILAFYGGDLPHVFTAHYGDGGISAALLRSITGIPYTFTAHSLGAQKRDGLLAAGESIDEDRYHFTRRLEAERVAMNHAGIVITSTNQERYAQYGHSAYAGAIDPNDDRRFAVVPPGVDQTVFYPGDADDSTARQIRAFLKRDLETSRIELPAVVSSSRLDPKKNHRVLIDAFGHSEELRSRANLVLITGAIEDPLHDDGPASRSERRVLAGLREAITAYDLGGAVSGFAIGNQRSLADAYRFFAARTSVFALTALYEPFGLAPLEAASTGLPVVVTRNGGPAESLRDERGEYGVLVDPSDPDDVASGLLRALDQWHHFAREGRRRVLERYTWDRTAQGYVAAIERALTVPVHPTEPIPAWCSLRS
ncbi:MAG: glycosyltransferase family 1 protein [Actinobacteria bacterium]|nr:glycosyltransferase family 1 protein [Actinomycetota bacterium]